MRGMWGVEDPLAFSGVEVRLHGFLIHLVQSIMIIQFVVRTHEISSTVRLGLFDVPSDRHESSKSVYKLGVHALNQFDVDCSRWKAGKEKCSSFAVSMSSSSASGRHLPWTENVKPNVREWWRCNRCATRVSFEAEVRLDQRARGFLRHHRFRVSRQLFRVGVGVLRLLWCRNLFFRVWNGVALDDVW